MASLLNYNGNLIPKNYLCISAQNQISQFGLFETMKYSNGKIKNLTDHFGRLLKGINLLEIKIPSHFTQGFFNLEIEKLLKACNYNFARVRLSILATPDKISKQKINFTIEASTLKPEIGSWQNEKFTSSIFSGCNILANKLSAIKHNNRLPYLMAKKFSAENNYNDVFLLNQHGRICDSTIANIFLIKDNVILTPLINEGCIDGIMRKNIIKRIEFLGHNVYELPIEIKTVAEADEIFITNSIINMQPVSAFNNKSLQTSFTHNLYLEIKKYSDLFD